MYDHIFYKQVQISGSDIRPHIKWAVSLMILHMVTSIFLQGLCGYIWVNILTLSPQRGDSWMEFLSPCYVIHQGVLDCAFHCRQSSCLLKILVVRFVVIEIIWSQNFALYLA